MPERPRLLVIDDDRQIAEAVAVRLRAASYDVQCAHDGQTGVAAAMQRIPSAIVLDIRMPKLDGFAVLSKLREQEHTREVPVVVLSASAVDERKALDAGAFCFLPKPYDPQLLLASISSALHQDHPLSTRGEVRVS